MTPEMLKQAEAIDSIPGCAEFLAAERSKPVQLRWPHDVSPEEKAALAVEEKSAAGGWLASALPADSSLSANATLPYRPAPGEMAQSPDPVDDLKMRHKPDVEHLARTIFNSFLPVGQF